MFMSYSHDSPEHKRWVGDLGKALMDSGVDVILDQWDLRLGDDVPKFMEKSVSEADRVLMVCSEQYVIKADDGKGGVGYETMVVTGELVRNLGTSKFIPVIRQAAGPPAVPTCVSTRLYVDFSDDDRFQEALQELLRELHDTPAVAKPKLGPSPFRHEPSPPAPVKIDSIAGYELPDLEQEPGVSDLRLYDFALDLARQSDKVAWRRAVRELKKTVRQRLLAWRAEREAESRQLDEQERQACLMAGALQCFPLMAVALAGVESGQEWFSKQSGVVEDLLSIPGWEPSGNAFLVRSPRAFACIYHTLHGAMCVQTEQVPLAIRLAETSVHPDQGQPWDKLYQATSLTGYLETLGEHSDKTSAFLYGIPEAWPWLASIYGSAAELEGYIATYYLALSILELTDALAAGRADEIDQLSGNLMLFHVPSCFFIRTPETTRRTRRSLHQNADAICGIWRDKGVPDGRMKESWSKWFGLMAQGRHPLFMGTRSDTEWFANLIEELLS